MTPARDPKQIKEQCRRSCNHVAVIMEEESLVKESWSRNREEEIMEES